MGTRAVIRKNGKVICATHWDGYPRQLGRSLVIRTNKDKSIKNILAIGSERHIDFVDNKNLPLANEVSIKTQENIINEYNKKIKTAKTDWEKELYESQIKTAKEFINRYKKSSQIGNLKMYDDFAEWDYDIRDDGVYVAKRNGSFRENKVSDYKKLTLGNLEELEKRGEEKGIDFIKRYNLSRKSGFGKGWFYESERHRLARLKGYNKYGR